MQFFIYLYSPSGMPSFYKKAIGEYEKRLGRYGKVSLRLIRKEKEWRKCLTGTEAGWYIVPGPSFSSEEFSEKITGWEGERRKEVSFFIGTEEDGDSYPHIFRPFSLSCFRMEGPMTAMILTEQIYRGYRIIHHHPYHK